MKLIIGLGNPGSKFEGTRHNVGFVVADKLAQMVNGKWKMDKRSNSLIIDHLSSIIFSKPQTFMNSSGEAVKKLAKYLKIKSPDIWVIHDDLDIKLGTYKVQFGRGPKVHNGLLSIYEKLGTRDFWHVRVGIDNRSPRSGAGRAIGEEYVLGKVAKRELETIKVVVDRIAHELFSSVLTAK